MVGIYGGFDSERGVDPMDTKKRPFVEAGRMHIKL